MIILQEYVSDESIIVNLTETFVESVLETNEIMTSEELLDLVEMNILAQQDESDNLSEASLSAAKKVGDKYHVSVVESVAKHKFLTHEVKLKKLKNLAAYAAKKKYRGVQEAVEKHIARLKKMSPKEHDSKIEK
jgi:fumarylacetoacetate (FAA) hydrolase family protein